MGEIYHVLCPRCGMPKEVCVCEELGSYRKRRRVEIYVDSSVPLTEISSAPHKESSPVTSNEDEDEDIAMPISVATEDHHLSGKRHRIKAFKTIAKINLEKLSKNVIKMVAPKVGNLFRCKVGCDGKNIVMHGRFQETRVREALQKMLPID